METVKKKCSECQGHGVVPSIDFIDKEEPCDACEGTGFVEVESEPIDGDESDSQEHQRRVAIGER